VRILLDTSVLVAAMVEAHPAHMRALPWLQKAQGGTDTWLVAAHSLAELYAILTTLPVRPRINRGSRVDPT
jgi:predicted nucleic acid-binding protein